MNLSQSHDSREARRLFFDKGTLPSHLVDDTIIQSWLRCAQERRGPGDRIQFHSLTPTTTRQLLQRHDRLIAGFDGVVSRFRQVFAQSRFHPVLTDARATIIASHAADASDTAQRRGALTVGVDMSESAIGTAAMNCALEAGRSVQVVGAEHYFESNADFQCAAAPIHSPDGSTHMQRAAIAPSLYEIVYSAKQNAVFVASAGNQKDPASGRIYRLDPETLAVQAEIKLDRRGLGLTLDDEANRLYVGNAFDASVTVVDTQTNQQTAIVQLAEKVSMKDPEGKPIERYPHNLRELVLDKQTGRLFAPGIWFTDSVLYVVDTRRLELEKVLPGFGFGVAGAALDAGNERFYASNMQGQLFSVNTKTLAVEHVAEVAADQLLNLEYDPAKRLVLATDQGSDQPDMVRSKIAKLDYQVRGPGNRVVLIDPLQGKVVQSIDTGKLPVALRIDAPRHRLYVTNRGSGTVSVHDSRDYRLLGTYALPAHPNSLAINPANGDVYVTVKGAMGNEGKEDVVRISLP